MTTTVKLTSVSVVEGGSGFGVDQILSVTGGTYSEQAKLIITSVSSGSITGLKIYKLGVYSTTPTNPVVVTGGTGTGVQLSLVFTPISVLALSTIKPDLNDMVTQLQNALASKESWKDLLTTATGQAILEFIAAVGTYDQYSIESALQETNLDTAKLDSSVYGITRTLGVRLGRKTPGNVTVDLVRPASTESFIIPKFTQFSSKNTQLFNRQAIVFAANDTTQTAVLYEGAVTVTDPLSSPGGDFQSFLSPELSFSVSDLDVICTINNIEIPVVVDNLWSYPSESAVQDRTTSTGGLQLMFGNALFGTTPITGDSVTVTYAVTKGIEGNNSGFSGTKVNCDTYSTITGVASSSISNGANQISTTAYRKISPLLFAANNRCITRKDYESIVLTYNSVLDCQILGQAFLSPTNLTYMNLVRVSLLTISTWSTAEWDAFVAWLQTKSMYSTRFYRQDPTARIVDVSATITCRNNVDLVACKNAVSSALSDFFSSRIGSIGRDIYKSDIYELIKNSFLGIDYIQLTSPSSDIIGELIPPDFELIPTHGETRATNTAYSVGKFIEPATPDGHVYKCVVAGTSSAGAFVPSGLTGVETIDGTVTWKEYGATSAGTIPIGLYDYQTVGVGALGVTLGSVTQHIGLDVICGVRIKFNSVPYGTTGYKVYGRTGTIQLIATTGIVAEYIDTGSITPTGALPQFDTSGVHYPSLGSLTLNVGYTNRSNQ